MWWMTTKVSTYSPTFLSNECAFYCTTWFIWNGSQCVNTFQNGLCGSSSGQSFSSAPTTNLCAAGLTWGVTTNPTTFTWPCSGIGTGTSMNCSSTRVFPVNGLCHATTNHSANNASFPWSLCATWTIASTGVNVTNYSWYCNGLNGWSNSPLCEACRTGYSWDGSACVAVVNGVCNATTNHSANNAVFPSDPTLCTAGSIATKTTNANNYTWYCNGIAGWSNSPLCEACNAWYAWDGSSCTVSTPGACWPANGGSYIW
jgi:hypothetical protein